MSFRILPVALVVVGDGARIRFWEDLWLGDQLLCSQFLSLFRIITIKNHLISSILGFTHLCLASDTQEGRQQ